MKFSLVVILILIALASASGSTLRWDSSLRPLSDTAKPMSYLHDSVEFRDKVAGTYPKDVASGGYMILRRSHFSASEILDPSIHISPHDQPMRLYLNGVEIYRFGHRTGGGISSQSRSSLVIIDPSILKDGENTLLMALFPRGELSQPPLVTLDTYESNSSLEFWQTAFSHTFVVNIAVCAILMAFLFCGFWIASGYDRRDFFYFALASFFLSLGYIHIVFNAPNHSESILWIVSRSSLVAASVCFMIFMSHHASTEKTFSFVNKGFLTIAAIFFIAAVILGDRYRINELFGFASIFVVTPTLFLTLYHAILKTASRSRQHFDVLIVFGILSLVASAFHDMYHIQTQQLPFFWTIPYGYGALQIIIVLSLFRDLLRLYLENREKADLLEEKNALLEYQKRRIEIVSSGKSRFIRNMSHEFKTPLQGMASIADLIKSDGGSIESLSSILPGLNAQLQRHLHHIQNVMELTILEEGRPDIVVKEFEFSDLIDSVLLLFGHNELNKGVGLSLLPEDGIPSRFCGPFDQIVRIVVNVISNIVSVEGGCISCIPRWDEEQRFLKLYIKSDLAFRAAALDILSQHELDDESELIDRDEIGELALCASVRIIGFLGGSIDISSNYDEISISFPLEPIVKLPEVETYSGKVMIVEDNDMNRKVIAKIVQSLGFPVIVAESGLDAIDKTIKERPSLIFMDVQMPGMDGLQATREIRKIDRTVVIVALTANGNRDECLASGMNDFVAKPARMNDLKGMIDRYYQSA